jgi:hypothetical protein
MPVAKPVAVPVAELVAELVEAVEAVEAVEPKTGTRLVGARQRVNFQLKFQPFCLALMKIELHLRKSHRSRRSPDRAYMPVAKPMAELVAEVVEAAEAAEAIKAVGSDLRISKPAPRFFAHFQCTVVRSPKVRRDRLRMTNLPVAVPCTAVQQ